MKWLRKRRLRAAAAKRLGRDAQKVTGKDVDTVVDRAEEIRQKFEAKGPLGRLIRDVKLMLSLIRDYRSGAYREVPWWVIAAVSAALLYVLSPVDLIPDFIPVLGVMDDAAVVTVCLRMVEQQLHEYEQWKMSRPS